MEYFVRIPLIGLLIWNVALCDGPSNVVDATVVKSQIESTEQALHTEKAQWQTLQSYFKSQLTNSENFLQSVGRVLRAPLKCTPSSRPFLP